MNTAAALIASALVAASVLRPDVLQDQPIPELSPGSPDLTPPLVDRSCDSLWFSARDSGATGWKDILPARIEYRPIVTRGRGDALLMLTSSGGRVVDSALFRRHTLAPVWEVSDAATRVERYTFSGSHVAVTTTSADSAPRTQALRHSRPFFTFQELDLLMRSLPLRAGYRALLPLFSEGDDSIEVDTAEVQHADSAGRWSIRFADPAVTATYIVDGHTRALVSYEHVFRTQGPMWRAGTVWRRRLAACTSGGR